MKKITLLKYTMGVMVVTVVAGALIAPSVKAWGPERQTYTNESPAPYATFNSITNNVAVGDERNFVRVREIAEGNKYKDEAKVVPGKEYEVYIYFHNDAGSNTNTKEYGGYGIATDVRVRSEYPEVLNPNERSTISGVIFYTYVNLEDKAFKTSVWDEAYLTTDYENVVLSYKPDTLIIHNGGKANGTVLPDAFWTKEGTPIGYNKLSGTLHGCAEYSGYITYTLVANVTTSELTKTASVDGENWLNRVEAEPGEYVDYKAEFKNTGTTTIENVVLRDSHSDELTIRSGSVKIIDAANPSGKVIDDTLGEGYNIGSVAPGATVQLLYQVEVGEVDSCKELKNTIIAVYDGNDQNMSSSTVEAGCKPGEEPEPVPDPVPEPPAELPNTGPVEIVMAIVIVLGIAVGGFYLYRTRKTLNVVKKKVSGKETDKKNLNLDPETHKTENNREEEHLNQKPEEHKK